MSRSLLFLFVGKRVALSLIVKVFPEGTCVNNEYVVMFKRGAFELGMSLSFFLRLSVS
jgi:1-acyl-sn-glycerol-3-phosphate acyltransferase